MFQLSHNFNFDERKFEEEPAGKHNLFERVMWKVPTLFHDRISPKYN